MMAAARVGLVTGSASGIGNATVARLRDQGHVAYGIDLERPQHGDGLDLVADVTDICALESAVSTLWNQHGRLDFVVANAGTHHAGDVEETDTDQFERVMAVNVKGLFFTLKVTIPYLKQQQAGAIVAIGSDQSLVGKRKSAVYAASKGAVLQLARSTAIDYAPHGIRVNCVCPGPTETPAFRHGVHEASARYAGGNDRIVERMIRNSIPLRAIAQPQDIAAIVAFLCSPDARFITGAAFCVDGGYTAQ